MAAEDWQEDVYSQVSAVIDFDKCGGKQLGQNIQAMKAP